MSRWTEKEQDAEEAGGDWEPVGDVKGPKGDTGDKGDKGDPGQPGDTIDMVDLATLFENGLAG